ncbi:eCIS core domain-containing protein [Streptomyces sp. NPDC002787]
MRAEGNARRPETERHGRGPARTPSAGPATAAGAPSHALAALQSSAGNSAVVQLLRQAGHPGARDRAGAGTTEEQHTHGPGCGHPESGRPPVQRSGERDVRQSAVGDEAWPQGVRDVQRSAVHDVLRTGGRPLDEATRGDMEARLGADFSDVRIHDDAAARASAAEVGARAYTSGSHVVIGEGGGDRHTLAHELTHVIQQRQGPVAGTDNGSGLRISNPGDAYERAAEANAARALSQPAPMAPVAAQRSVAAPPSAGTSVQRREDNPYAKPAEHDGWATTAHHIVAHSTLLGALGRLDENGRREVLAAAVPREITEQMLDNLKVKVPDGANTPEFRRDLRKKLADQKVPDSENVYGISYGDIRQSFFEWQAGNQFIGPNTSTRAEPSASKDDIDTDGKYFTSLNAKDFDKLVSLGTDLKTPGIAADKTQATLLKMLALTKNAKVADFDPAKWTEVKEGTTVDALAADTGLSRAHIRGYTYFKLAMADVVSGKHRDFTTAASGGNFEYYGATVNDAQVRGTFVYIPFTTTTVPPPKEGKSAGRRKTLFEYCTTNNVPTCTFLPKGLYNPDRKPLKK